MPNPDEEREKERAQGIAPWDLRPDVPRDLLEAYGAYGKRFLPPEKKAAHREEWEQSSEDDLKKEQKDEEKIQESNKD